MDFFRVSQQRGFSRDFMMRVTSLGDDSLNEDDMIYITTKTLPSRLIANQQATFMGLPFNVPGTVSYPGSDSWSVVFRNDMKGIVRKKLEDWQTNKVFDDETSIGDLSVRGRDKLIQLELINDKQEILNTYKLYGAYIKDIGALEGYNLEGNGSIMTFTAQIAYHFWRHE